MQREQAAAGTRQACSVTVAERVFLCAIGPHVFKRKHLLKLMNRYLQVSSFLLKFNFHLRERCNSYAYYMPYLWYAGGLLPIVICMILFSTVSVTCGQFRSKNIKRQIPKIIHKNPALL